jgi:S1-C subfamily serine protease
VSTDLRLDAIVSVKAHIPEDAMSAGLLGTERTGHGVRIRPDGLIATIGYIVNEADSVWVGTAGGAMVPAFVVGYDYESGFGLIKPAQPLPGAYLEAGSAGSLEVGDPVTVAASGGAEHVIEARVVAKQEFAGRWEYLLEEAVFTAPPHESWSGAALIDTAGRLCGIGSLVIQGFEAAGNPTTVNMFVPIDLLTPIVDEICEYGRANLPPRPWLGVLVHDDHEDLTVVGVYRNCPADRAGLKPGDVILQVNGQTVSSLGEMLRRIWALGEAGARVPLTVVRDLERIDLVIDSGDRAMFQRKGTVQ